MRQLTYQWQMINDHFALLLCQRRPVALSPLPRLALNVIAIDPIKRWDKQWILGLDYPPPIRRCSACLGDCPDFFKERPCDPWGLASCAVKQSADAPRRISLTRIALLTIAQVAHVD